MIDYFLPNDDEARVFTGQRDPVDQAAALVAAGARTRSSPAGREALSQRAAASAGVAAPMRCRSSIPRDAATPSPPA